MLSFPVENVLWKHSSEIPEHFAKVKSRCVVEHGAPLFVITYL